MEFLNYHHLRYFWMVAREGSLRRAAELMNLSQPTISAQISLLEESLGTPLFRRAGRNMVMTEAGRRAFEMASEIFSLGQELLDRVKREDHAKTLRLHLGVSDSLPKFFSWDVIQPIFALEQPVQLTCREGATEELLLGLAEGRLDLILADEPAPSSLKIRAFSSLIGKSGTTFCASKELAKKLGKTFPENLNGAPILLPLSSSAWRHSVDGWLQKASLTPRLVAEFEDAALMKVAAANGLGVVPIPTNILEHAKNHYQLLEIGAADDCSVSYYAITSQRRVRHPAVRVLMQERQAK